MSKYCGKCGTSIPDSVGFCPECGEKCLPSVGSNDNTQQTFYKPPKKFNKKLIYPILAVIAVIIIVVIIISGGGYKGVVKDYFSAIEKNNAKQMLAIAPEYWKDYQYADGTWSEDELIDEMYDFIENAYDRYDCGENIKITYEITSEYKPTKDEIESLEYVMYDWYAYYVYDKDDFKITDARLLHINVSVEGEDGKESFYYPDGFLVFKENGEWKILFGDVSTSWYSNQ